VAIIIVITPKSGLGCLLL